jgi:hypothetical protein
MSDKSVGPTGAFGPTGAQRRLLAGGGRSAGEGARKDEGGRRRGQNLANFDNQFAGSRLRSREHRQGALGHESANDAIVVARRATAMIASLAGAAVMIPVLVCSGMVHGRRGAMFACMAMPHAAQRAGEQIANC